MPRIVFHEPGAAAPIEIEVDDDTSILEAAEEADAKVGHSCGGVCACSTCHVYVVEGEDMLTEMDDAENDRLDMGFDVRPESRLGCQARASGDGRVVVHISEESLKAWYDEHPEARRRASS